MAQKNYFNFLHQGFLFVDSKGTIIDTDNSFLDILDKDKKDIIGRNIVEIIPQININEILKTQETSKEVKVGKSSIILHFRTLNDNKIKVKNLIIFYQNIGNENISVDRLEENKFNRTKMGNLINLNNKLVEAFNYCFDEIYITDSKGITLFVSKACEEFYGVKAENLIGKHVSALEKQGLFYPSIALKVLKSKQKVTLTQVTGLGKKILVTAYPLINNNGDVDSTVLISRDITELSMITKRLTETEELLSIYLAEIQRLKSSDNLYNNELVAESQQMKEITKMIEKIAKVDSTVLISGESGVGKGILAFLMHQLSNRFEKPFISVNCGAIPESLIETELFGYKPGAFTGALKSGKIGLFEVANGGTIFLDEISEIPLNLQVKLLHVIQNKQIRRVGSNSDINIDVRIIAATNQNIYNLVREGKFREDLYYRINVVPLEVPPLRQRIDDIIPLVNSFIKKFNDKYRKCKQISDGAKEIMIMYKWPGNVRELENLIERLCVTTEENKIESYHLPSYMLECENINQRIAVLGICSLKEATEELETQLLKKAYEKYHSTYRIAEVLKVNQSTVVRKINKYLDKITKTDDKTLVDTKKL